MRRSPQQHPHPMPEGPEKSRLDADAARTANWKRWGPYLAERQWGTVREDYSPDGACWDYFPHDHARSRAYRWGEDGLLGWTDRQCRLCFAVALWNGRDPILKERLFGLTNDQGNHGEDVKECYYYLDSTPTHSYARALYKYPQAEYPYSRLLEENARRGLLDPEFELEDTGVFQSGYWDVQVEYAKQSDSDILIRLTVFNQGPKEAELHLLPTFWFRNTWSWGCSHEGCWRKPHLRVHDQGLIFDHASLGDYRAWVEPVAGQAALRYLVTENETNHQRVFGGVNTSPYVKDAFHEYVIHGKTAAVNPQQTGTKAAAYQVLRVGAGEHVSMRVRLTAHSQGVQQPFGTEFDDLFALRLAEADQFYNGLLPPTMTADERRVSRQAYAGLLWTKQYYHYVVADWLQGDADQPPPPPGRKQGRNRDWGHFYVQDILSMPDKWEYPWFAAWDLAFHCLPLAHVDPEFAKRQLLLLLREWYMHPNGQLPAYEFAFSDVNPPVHAWAAWRVYKITGARGERDILFLQRVFHKLLINFTWWVNRKDHSGRHIFSGGFLGLDNIGVFDRGQPLPNGGFLEQADGTAWMGFYCLTMLAMALELANEDPAYEDVASKFFEHFIAITDAINSLNGGGLWDEADGFYYDHIRFGEVSIPVRLRSMVGLLPLLAVEVLDDRVINHLPGFRRRMEWFLEHRGDLAAYTSYLEHRTEEGSGHRLLALPSRARLERVLGYLLHETEFLAPHGVRSMSRIYAQYPYVLHLDGRIYDVSYAPAESQTHMFGSNSNWRGPIWFPVNYLLIEALERYGLFYGDELQVECPVGSGIKMNLTQVAEELERRLAGLFLPDAEGRTPWQGAHPYYREDPHWRELVLFHEYFDGDNGRGVGAAHQTGWTALIARILEDRARARAT